MCCLRLRLVVVRAFDLCGASGPGRDMKSRHEAASLRGAPAGTERSTGSFGRGGYGRSRLTKIGYA